MEYRDGLHWGILLGRFIARKSEAANWPYVTRRLMPSWTGQFAHLEGLENISPGRNLQFIPYAMFSRARFLEPAAPGLSYVTENDARAGIDAKMVLRDALTLDMALNPDFSQVESDNPQVTVNQRYEVFFPEKRPFFIENSDYFQTPENLFFSRRVVDPQFGIRMTGKLGRWGVGVLAADDRAPGKLAADDDPLHGDRAAIGVFRLYREIGSESRVGMLATSRDFGPGYNRVAALDTRLKFGRNWSLTGQWMGSKTRTPDGSRYDGMAGMAQLSRAGRQFHMNARYVDRSPDFDTQLGFFTRVNMREASGCTGWVWRPEASTVVSFGPHIYGSVTWSHDGTLTDWMANPSFSLELTRTTNLMVGRVESYERFAGTDFRKSANQVNFNSQWLNWLHLSANLETGESINYYPAPGLAPFLAKSFDSSFGFTLQPGPRLRVDETYLYSRLDTPGQDKSAIFNNHILRSKFNYQFTREASLRAIVDYNAVLPNTSLVSLGRTKRLGLDFLFTYMLHPGTALHAGYTDNYENLHFDPLEAPSLRRNGFPDTSVGRQVFVKLSYLLRM